MSQEKIKEKKPFLKKGTRQFLSNAQVRSQSSKPKIVDFGATQEQLPTFPSQPAIKTKNHNNMPSTDDQIKIKAKPSINKPNIPVKRDLSSTKKAERSPAERNNDHSAHKPKREASIGRKKQAALSDYLDNQSGLGDYTQKRPSKFREEANNGHSNKKQQEKPERRREQNIRKPMPMTKANNLVQQEEEQQQCPNFIQNDSFKPISNPIRNRQPFKVEKEKPTHLNRQTKQVVKQEQEQQEGNKQVNFISDDDDNEEEVSYKRKVYGNKSIDERKQNIVENHPPVSKIKMNFFNKDGNGKPKTVTAEQNKPREIQKKLSISDIPKELKQQIVKEALNQKQQQLIQELMKLKDKKNVVLKEKEIVEEEQKKLAKARQQFEKEMQEKNRQFEQKIKNQNSKLAREKKYMKEAQMTGKGDWKAKAELEEAKKTIQQLKQQKKKVESKLKVQVENLRKKLEEEVNKNKLLSQQVKLLEYGQVMHKQQMKEMVKQQKKNSQQHKTVMWADVPSDSYLNKIFDENFCLLDMDIDEFHYQYNQFYQYYLRVKDDVSPLESQTTDNDRAKRVYKNGKIEHQYYQKFLKEVFPFNYTIVSLWNGDVKQILPSGIQVYYSKNPGVTSITLKQKGITKQICFFSETEAAQMTVVNENDPSKNITEVYTNGNLKRLFSDGTCVHQKKDYKGNIFNVAINA